MILRQTIWGVLEKNIRLEFGKGWVIPEEFVYDGIRPTFNQAKKP